MKKLVLMLTVAGLVFGLVGMARPSVRAQDNVEIVFAHIFTDDKRAAAVQAIADAFMAANPNITVTLQANTDSYDELFNSALLAAEQGNAPHLIQVDESLTQSAIDSGAFIAINEIATDEQAATLSDFLPQITDFYSVGGQLWGLPWNNSNPLLYFNKDIFTAAGLDPNAPPTTFDEVLSACEAIVAANIEGLEACANWPLVTWFPEQWMAMQGALVLNNDNGRTARASEIFLTAPEMLKIVEWWKTMRDNGYYIYSGKQQDYTGDAITFLSKKTAIHINSTAGLSNFIQFSGIQGFELGVAPLIRPSAEANQGLTVGGASVFVSAGYPEAETHAARDFAFFLTNTENIAFWHKESGYLPNRQSSIDMLEAEGWFESNPFYAIALEQLQNSELTPATAGLVVGQASQVRGIWLEAMQSILDGGADPAEAMGVAKGRIDEFLAEYNALFE